MDVKSAITILHNPILIITCAYFITWGYTLFSKMGWVSDDHEGVEKFSERYDQKNHVKLDKYREGPFVEVNGKKEQKEYWIFQFNKDIPFPGSVIRWLRINFGKTFKVIGKNQKDHEVYGYVQDPRKHHILSLAIDYLNTLLVYFFIKKLFGADLALMTTLVFAVHPVSNMCRAWISGIGYLICLFGMMLLFNLVLYFPHDHLHFFSAIILTVVSVSGLLPGMFNFIPLLVFGDYWAAGGAFLVTAYFGYKKSKEVVQYRINQFKSQNMEHPTKIRPTKIFYIVKTYLYYICLVIFPKRLGLFHKLFYHHEETIEKPTRMFWLGVVVLSMVCGIFYYGDYAVKFGVAWFVIYLSLFSNLITAMQALSERYTFIPSLGFALVLSSFLHPYPSLFAFVLGLYAMRTMVHLVTYKDEIAFYRSNVFNFPDSEVAYGNLGVALMNSGRGGSAVDTWMHALSINDKYDVPSYNLYSIFRQNGQFGLAKQYLEKCLNSKIVHFDKVWKDEYKRLLKEIEINKPLQHHANEISNKMRVFK